MTYCIYPDCKHPQNPDNLNSCQGCGNPLLIYERYRLLKPLRPLNPRNYTDIFEVDDGGTRKVMKVLKDNSLQLVEMFEREAMTLQLLDRLGIPKVDIDGYFSFTPNDSTQKLHCLVMEKVEGQNLEQWVETHGRISQSIAMKWLRQLIQILDALHQNHFFHRDIKPSNIMLKPDGQLVLIDFGSVRGLTETYLAKLNIKNATTIFSGGYTPQEQIDGKAIPQSDFYALGRTFVHLLTGKQPGELAINSHTGQLIWRKKAPQISKPLADFIDELMAPFPADRPQNTRVILRYLTKKGLLIQSIVRQINSPQFRFKVVGFLLIGLIYRLSFPAQAQYYYDRGVEAQQAKNLEKALQYYEKALEFNPREAKIYNNLGLICQNKQNLTCAIKNYEQALDFDPSNPVARYNLGGVYDDSGDLARAKVQYQLAMQSRSPVAANAISDLARLRILDGDAAGAIALSLQGLQQTDKPKVRSALYKNLGWACFVQTAYAEAETSLRQAIKFNSDRTDAYCLLAQVLEVRDEKLGALVAWQDCLNHDSKNRIEVKVWQTMARQRLKDAGSKK